MDQFHDGHHVRLRSRVHGTYLHAADDGESVYLRRPRNSLNVAWAVHVYQRDDGLYLLLHSAAYGRYLGATTTPAPIRIRHRGFRTEQRDYDQTEVEAIMWQAVGAGFKNDVLLRNASGLYLRANGRCYDWNTGVSDDVSDMMYWVVEPIPPRYGTPGLPPPVPGLVLTRVRRHPSAIVRSRLVRFVLASAEGLYTEDGWSEFHFSGRSVHRLRNELVSRVGVIDMPDGLVMCVRAGRYGRVTPLVVHLPYGETLQIVLMLSGTPVYDELRHLDVDAETPAYDELRHPDVDAE